MSDDELIKEVKDDDDLDMSTLGKPVAAFKPIAKPTDSPAASPGKSSKSKADAKSKLKRDLSKGTEAALWSQLDDEIADVSDDGLDDPTDEPLPIETTPKKSAANGSAQPPNSSTKRGVLPGGLSGGAQLGSVAPLKEGPKDHSYGVEDGEARARVYDTPELRAAFLHYCKSNIKVTEMHLVHEGPFLAAQQFVQMCRDYRLLEPEGGKLSLVMVGIIYTTSKSDDEEGLAFGQFLDSLVSLAFECETNVAGALQSDWDKKDVLNKNKAENVLARPPRVRPNGKSVSVAGIQDSEPSTAGGTGTSTPGAEYTQAPALSRTISKCATKIMELLESEPPVPKPKKEGPKARFQTVETLTHSSVLDKVNAVSNIKSMATTRATSVINSRVTSRMVSRLPSRRASRDGELDEEEEEDDDMVDLNAKIGPAAAATAQGAAYQVSPALLSKHMHAALNAYDDYVDDDVEPSPRSSLAGLPNRGKSILVQGPKGQPISPLFAVASHAPLSPGATSPGAHTPSGGGGLRPTTAARGRSLVGSSAPSTSFRVLTDDVVNKGFGSDDEEEEVDLFEQEITAKAKAQVLKNKGTVSEGGTASDSGGKASLKSAISKKVRAEAFGSPVGSMRARFQSDSGALTSSGSMADAAARAIATVDAELRASGEQPQISPKPPLGSSKLAAGGKPPTGARVAKEGDITPPGKSTKSEGGIADPADKPLSAYEQKLAALEAKYKSKGEAAAAAAANEDTTKQPAEKKPSKPKAVPSTESAANALKSMLIEADGSSGGAAARQPMLIEKEDLALMASFGQGVAAAPAPAPPKRTQKTSNSGTPAASGTAGIEDKLAAIEKRIGDGSKAAGAPKPQPPSGPAPGAISTSPRTSTNTTLKKVAAAEAKAASQAGIGTG